MNGYSAADHLADYLIRIGLVLDGCMAEEAAADQLARMTSRERAGLPIVELQHRAGLDRHALDILVAAAAPSLELGLAARLRERLAGATPTVEELVAILAVDPGAEPALLAALAHDAPLLAHGLVTRAGADTAPLAQHVRVDERVVGFLRGSTAIDRRLRGIATLHDRPNARSARHDHAPASAEPATVDRIARALATPGAPVVVEGPARVGKTTAVIAALVARGRRALVVDLERVVEEPQQLGAIRREALLADAQIVMRAGDWSEAWPAAIRRDVVAAVQAGEAIVTVRDGDAIARAVHAARRIAIAMPAVAVQEQIWRDALAAEVSTAEVCARYPLPPGDIVIAAAAARATAEVEQRAVTPADLAAAARARVCHRLGDVAELVDTTLEWSDVVLRADVAARVRELVDAVRHRDRVMEQWGFGAKLPYGRSTAALFSGPPGTGKTMVATLVGKQLGLEVFRVDLSRIVSKYIGETEKNLARVFDEASRCRAILLFDEADSLFAKRTEVRSSNDRYANLEVNFLLQRLEAHDGIVILTTNAATAIDGAFLRRLRYRIEFPRPDAHERTRLWRAMIPASAPIADDVNFAELGRRFAMSGGHIKNAVVRAAYAAAAGGALDHATLECAAAHEWSELGHLTAPEPLARGSTPVIVHAAEPPAIASPSPSPSPSPSGLDEPARRVLASSPHAGETIDVAFRRKERELGELFATLDVGDAFALHRRLATPAAGDDVAELFARLAPDRRVRLLAFLADVRRRQATSVRRARQARG